MKKQKTDLQIKKDEIRKQILEKRSNLSLEEVDKKSELIIENLTPYLKNAQNIMKMSLFCINLGIMSLLQMIFMMRKFWIL